MLTHYANVIISDLKKQIPQKSHKSGSPEQLLLVGTKANPKAGLEKAGFEGSAIKGGGVQFPAAVHNPL